LFCFAHGTDPEVLMNAYAPWTPKVLPAIAVFAIAAGPDARHSIPLLLGLLGQTPPQAGDAAALSRARLEFMKKCMARYDIRALDDRGTKFQLQAEPVLRFTNPVGGSKDGALFLWTADGDRPAVVSQIYWNPQEIWMEEFSSLWTGPLTAKSEDAREWRTSEGGVSFKPVPDAPRTAETPERRLRQMRELADGFSAEHLYKGTTWNKLRLLTKPFARYGKKSSDVEDGALFCYVHGTDPELLLLLEARPGQDGLHWHYAFAPVTGFALNAFWKGKEIWSLPRRNNGPAWSSTNTFYARRVAIAIEE
jgi:hypothetical protein